MKPAGAAAVSGVENPGICDSASGSVCSHTRRSPRPHTPVLSPQHPAAIQRIYPEGVTPTQSVESEPHAEFNCGVCNIISSVSVKAKLRERHADGGNAADDPRLSGKNTAPPVCVLGSQNNL